MRGWFDRNCSPCQGMKVWGLSLEEEEWAAWSQMVRELADVFKLIPSAQVL